MSTQNETILINTCVVCVGVWTAVFGKIGTFALVYDEESICLLGLHE